MKKLMFVSVITVVCLSIPVHAVPVTVQYGPYIWSEGSWFNDTQWRSCWYTPSPIVWGENFVCHSIFEPDIHAWQDSKIDTLTYDPKFEHIVVRLVSSEEEWKKYDSQIDRICLWDPILNDYMPPINCVVETRTAYVWSKQYQAVVVPVPEPSTIVLLGLGGVALVRRRRGKTD